MSEGNGNGAAAASADGAAIDLFQSVFKELATKGRTDRVDEIRAALDGNTSRPVKSQLANLLTHVFFRQGDYERALPACLEWLDSASNKTDPRNSLLSILIRLKRFDEVIAEASERLKSDPDDWNLHSALANAFGHLGKTDEAREHGRTTMALKVKEAEAEPFNLEKVTIPAFDPGARDRNVIAFSLFGSDRKYCDGAVRNAVAAHFVYPEWTCRFYVDTSVPRAVIDRLLREGAKVTKVGGMAGATLGTFWRFLAADDDTVDRLLFRDCDGCVGIRERSAVDQWLDSDKHFHVMRDWYTHTEPIMAGMWGSVRGSLPSMKDAIGDFTRSASMSRTLDQQFLRRRIWPTVRQSVLAHDSFFGFDGAVDFPRAPTTPALRVGVTVSEPKVAG